MRVSRGFLIVQEYRCPLCGVQLTFFRRKYDDSGFGALHPNTKCARSKETYYVPHVDLTVMEEEFR